jgi:arsenate reductase
MAEGWARTLAPELAPELNVEVSSAGLEAHGLNPNAVSTMASLGVDISSQTSDIMSDGMLAKADLVVSVCYHADANCPLLPHGTRKQHLPFDDPASATGSQAEIDAVFLTVCKQIREGIAGLLQELAAQGRS